MRWDPRTGHMAGYILAGASIPDAWPTGSMRCRRAPVDHPVTSRPAVSPGPDGVDECPQSNVPSVRWWSGPAAAARATIDEATPTTSRPRSAGCRPPFGSRQGRRTLAVQRPSPGPALLEPWRSCGPRPGGGPPSPGQPPNQSLMASGGARRVVAEVLRISINWVVRQVRHGGAPSS